MEEFKGPWEWMGSPETESPGQGLSLTPLKIQNMGCLTRSA